MNKTQIHISNAILLLAFLVGLWLRFTPAIQAGFPINDGGMFYSMIGDLQTNNYNLPEFTSYNRAENIPFAYPPFPFYLAALLNGIFHVPVIEILLWLPALISAAVVLAFYLMAKSLLDSRLPAAFATLFFALIPRTFSWFLMGGGLTRSFGQLFLILTAVSVYSLFLKRGRRYLVFTIIAGTLAVLSHPEAAIHTAGIALLIWFFKARKMSAFLDSILVAVGVCVATALWWLPVLSMHGITPFLNAAQTGNHAIQAWIPLFTFNFTQEPLLPLITLIGILGLFVSIAKRDYFFAAWLILPFILEPRSAPWIVTMPLAMLAALALSNLLLPALNSLNTTSSTLLQNKVVLAFLGGLIFYSLLGSYAFALKMGANHMDESDRTAMAWIAKNTPPESRFLVLTDASDPMNDPIQEWFPALTQRNSQTTLQGKEWTWGGRFIETMGTFSELQRCINLQCIQHKVTTLGFSFDYLYISGLTDPPCPTGLSCQNSKAILVEALKASPEYSLIYNNLETAVFQKR